MKYRSRTEISRAILESAVGGLAKTKIMYKAFLSYAQLKDYLDLLEKNGLLELNTSEQTYRTTPKGKKFLEISDSLTMMTTEGAIQTEEIA